MIPDAESIAVMSEILLALDLKFKVKLSHRILLDAVMEVCDVPHSKFRTICSAIDKLDKESWDTVRLSVHPCVSVRYNEPTGCCFRLYLFRSAKKY